MSLARFSTVRVNADQLPSAAACGELYDCAGRVIQVRTCAECGEDEVLVIWPLGCQHARWWHAKYLSEEGAEHIIAPCPVNGSGQAGWCRGGH